MSEVMEHVTLGFEVFGVAVLVIGLLASCVLAAKAWLRSRQGSDAYRVLRSSFGRTLLLGLEILVAADLIKTVAVAPTMENVLVLAVIVAIRTLLSFSLEVEIEGRLPWRAGPRRATDGAPSERG